MHRDCIELIPIHKLLNSSPGGTWVGKDFQAGCRMGIVETERRETTIPDSGQ